MKLQLNTISAANIDRSVGYSPLAGHSTLAHSFSSVRQTMLKICVLYCIQQCDFVCVQEPHAPYNDTTTRLTNKLIEGIGCKVIKLDLI